MTPPTPAAPATPRLPGRLADSGPVVVLALIAGAGSFTHIRDTAIQHGQTGWMAWAVAVCVDLTCVMAARERQHDKKTGRVRAGWISWPTLVLSGGIILSLAANLAQAEPSPWGWISAATPAGAFLIAVSMLERRASLPRPEPLPAVAGAGDVTTGPVPTAVPSAGTDLPEPPHAVGLVPLPALAVPGQHNADETQDNTRDDTQNDAENDSRADQNGSNGNASPSTAAGALLDYARRVAADHHAQQGKPITRDLLRARLGVSSQLASDLLRTLHSETTPI